MTTFGPTADMRWCLKDFRLADIGAIKERSLHNVALCWKVINDLKQRRECAGVVTR
jgi:hypothetical protein